MSRLEVPILHRKLWASGDVLLRAELALFLKAGSGLWQRVVFRVDSGAEITAMPASLAKRLGLPMPPKLVPNAVHRQTGLPFRSGFLRAKVEGMDSTEYGFPCFFLGDPDTPAGAAPGPTVLLGLSGVINQIRLTLDGTPGAKAAYGHLIGEKV